MSDFDYDDDGAIYETDEYETAGDYETTEDYEPDYTDGAEPDHTELLDRLEAVEQATYDPEPEPFPQEAHERDWNWQLEALQRDVGRPILASEWQGVADRVANEVDIGGDVNLAGALLAHWHNTGGRIDDGTRSGDDALWAERARDLAGESGGPTDAEIDKAVNEAFSENDTVRNAAEARLMTWRLEGHIIPEW